MTEIPALVKEYLTTDDAFVHAQMRQQNPELDEVLHAPETRQALLEWLQDEQAWDESMTSLALNCIEFLMTKATEAEAPIVRPYLLHRDRRVRLAAYEFMRSIYYPDLNRAAMNQLYQNMLMDQEDVIRSQAIRYLKQSGSVDELKVFLERWYKTAAERGWDETESYELVGQLLKGSR